jgi:hypothetical protein
MQNAWAAPDAMDALDEKVRTLKESQDSLAAIEANLQTLQLKEGSHQRESDHDDDKVVLQQNQAAAGIQNFWKRSKLVK